jgi:hypothetical protein
MRGAGAAVAGRGEAAHAFRAAAALSRANFSLGVLGAGREEEFSSG